MLYKTNANNNDARLQQIVESAITKKKPSSAETLVVAGHLAQMKTFILRAGVEFYPQQDRFNHQRKRFVDRTIKMNKLDLRYDSICDYFMVDGEGLFYAYPTANHYEIHWFRPSQYRTYYDQNNELTELVLIYSYKAESKERGEMLYNASKQLGATSGLSATRDKWVKLTVTRDKIIEIRSDNELRFEEEGALVRPQQKKELENTLGFICAVECFNNPDAHGREGAPEFNFLAQQIVAHDQMLRAIRSNLRFFGSPTLVSSRPKQDLLDNSAAGGTRPNIASQSGFSGMGGRNSTYKDMSLLPGSSGTGDGVRVPRLIANVEPNDRVGYIAPDAVSGDQNLYAAQYREEIRTVLGGVDELSIHAGSTAFEVKSIMGRAGNTATKKAKALFDYGLCVLFEMMIYNEEKLFRDSFAMAIGLFAPVPPPPEIINSPDGQAAVEIFQFQLKEHEMQVEQAMLQALDAQAFPPGLLGLVPDGDRSILWRWKGPVFEDSPRDTMEKSIVVRNMQELGVDSVEALKFLFPEKTEEERQGMLAGFPFRMISELTKTYTQLMGLASQGMQTPHPGNPELPMAADPNLNLLPYLYRTLGQLEKELNYGTDYKPADAGAIANLPSGVADEYRRYLRPADRTSPASDTGFTGREPGSLPPGANGNIGVYNVRLPGGEQPAGGNGFGTDISRGLDITSPVPSPGATYYESRAKYPNGLGFESNGIPGGYTQSGVQFGSPDIFAQYSIQPNAAAFQGGPVDANRRSEGDPAPRRRRKATKRSKRRKSKRS